MVKRIDHTVLTQEEIDHILKNKELFYLKSWRDAVTKGMDAESFAVLTSFMGDNALLGIYFSIDKGIIKLAGAPLSGTFTPYMDPLWFGNLSIEDKREIFFEQFKFLKKLGFSYIEYKFKDFMDAKDLGEGVKDFQLFVKETYILDLNRSLDEIWNDFSPTCRQSIKEAVKNRIEVEKIEACELDVEDFYAILQVLYETKGEKPRHSLKFLKEIVYRMQESNHLLFQRAVLDDKIISMKIYLFDHEKFFYLCDASLDLAYETKAVYLMHWNSIKFAKDLGVDYYDFNSKGDEVSDALKRSFSPYVYKRGHLSYKTAFAKSAEKIYKKINKIEK